MSNIAVMDAPSTPYLNTYLDIDDLLTRFFWLITVDLGRFSLACIYLNGAEDTSCVVCCFSEWLASRYFDEELESSTADLP